ncbi:MAG: HU family DNA-binding protein [Marinifilum sp.]|jgi:predicted histone-like DNA-binding protein|nr:HU family DNA-binding protein [Marinifilum sp.]
MSVEYKVVKYASPGVKGGGEYKYYPRITNRKTVKMKELCEHIEKMSTFSEADVMGVLHAFIKEIPDLLKDNCSIDLEGLGIFSLHASGEGCNTEQEVTARKITNTKIAFRPSKRLKAEVAGTKFIKARNFK